MPYVCTLELATSISHSTKPFCSPSSDQKMALAGKMMMYLEINSPGEVLHDIVRNRPNDIASMLPDKVHSCDLVEGQWGAVGSVICWNFTYGSREGEDVD
ncbi:putative Bet v I/Major latex protein [Helianthus annuus]|nr:putative Bet v I/Major latex protein [Helianthus annuus]